MKLSRLLGCSATGFAAVLASPVAAQVAPPPIEAYGELPTLEHMTLSPSGKLAMITSSEGKRLLVALDEDMKPITGMEVGDIKVRDLQWIGDDSIMLERSDTQDLGERFIARDAEIFNAMIIPIDGNGEVRTVFSDDKGILNAVFGNYGFRKLDGKWTGFFAGAPMKMGQRGQYFYDGASAALFAVDIATNKSRRLTTSPTDHESHNWLIAPDGEVSATMEFNNLTHKWRLVTADGREIASGSEPKGAARVMVFNQDGTKAVFATLPEKGHTKYFEVPLDGSGSATPIFEGIEIESLFYDPGSNRLMGYRAASEGGEENSEAEGGEGGQDEDGGEPVFFDANYQSTVGKVLEAFGPANGSMRSYDEDFSKLLIRTSGNNDSGTWYLVDTEAGSANVIGRERPLIKPNQVGPIQEVTYTAQDGLEIEGILTLPPGRKAENLAAIVLPHGGPRAHDTATFDWWAQAFASRGYAVLQPNFRGSTGYGEEFINAGDSEWGRKMQTDLSDGLQYLVQQGIADPKRACIMGASYGGYAALAGVTVQNGIYRCSVSVAGVSDLRLMIDQDYRETGSKDLREYWLEMMGDRNALSTISPRSLASRADAPILLIHGRDDTVVPYRQSEVMADALKDAGKPFKMIELGEEDHWLSRSATRKRMLDEALAFVQEHNPAD